MTTICLKAAYETEVYISAAGYLVIKQSNPMGDAQILLNPEQTEIIGRFIESNLGAQTSNWNADNNEGDDGQNTND